MERIQRLIPLVRPFYSSVDPAHDWPHIGRVAATARKLCKGQPVNEECVLAAVYCHDLVNLPKDHADRSRASTFASEKAEPLLLESGFTQEEVALIKEAIIQHSFSRGLKPTTLEAAIVQDADRLDALGAIGVLRCAAVNTQMKTSFYDPQDPLAAERPLDDKSFMLDHYFVKLFKLPEMMNTAAGSAEATRRVEYMRNFVTRLLAEIRN